MPTIKICLLMLIIMFSLILIGDVGMAEMLYTDCMAANINPIVCDGKDVYILEEKDFLWKTNGTLYKITTGNKNKISTLSGNSFYIGSYDNIVALCSIQGHSILNRLIKNVKVLETSTIASESPQSKYSLYDIAPNAEYTLWYHATPFGLLEMKKNKESYCYSFLGDGDSSNIQIQGDKHRVFNTFILDYNDPDCYTFHMFRHNLHLSIPRTDLHLGNEYQRFAGVILENDLYYINHEGLIRYDLIHNKYEVCVPIKAIPYFYVSIDYVYILGCDGKMYSYNIKNKALEHILSGFDITQRYVVLNNTIYAYKIHEARITSYQLLYY